MIWNADPVLFAFAGLKIHWYGALFATAIIAGLQLMKWIYAREHQPIEALDSLLTYAVIGIIIGARLGHCLFYDPGFYLSNPLKILAIWEGGLASHGGGLGVIIASYFYAKKHQVNYLWLLDKLAIATALFGFFVRMGNFVNSEIVGTVTHVPWAVIFSRLDELPRHPVQLYEALSYLTIFVILVSLYRKSHNSKSSGGILGVFLCLVFTARFLLEFIKQKQAAYTSELLLSTGQMLSIPFLLVGIALVVNALIKRRALVTQS